MQITSLSSTLTTLLPATDTVQGTGLKLGRWSEGNTATSTAGTATSTLPSGTTETFSAEILRRLQQAQTASNAGALMANGAADNLQNALTQTIDTVRQAHGDAAATAVMGIVLKGVGDGKGGEDAFGNAMVSALQFIDRNFGINAGDAAMAQFNGNLNDAINGYFQNGHNEIFHAATTTGSTDQMQSILSATLDDVTQRFGEQTAKAVSDILTASLEKTGFNRKGLGTALSAASAYLTDQYGEAATDDASLSVPSGDTTQQEKGTVVDLTV